MEDLREAIQLLLDTGATTEDIKWECIDGRYYTRQNLIEFAKEPMATPITASTLDAMIAYLAVCPEERQYKSLIIISDPKTVILSSGLNGQRNREVLFRCDALLPKHRLDQWLDQEEFMIYLASCFVDTEDRRIIQKYAGTVEAKTVATYGDDGFSQKATVSTGVASKAAVVLPNKVKLAPYRTFAEVAQPESEFVFRANENPMFRLIEADGGAWRLAAMKAIADYLSAALEGAGINGIPILR